MPRKALQQIQERLEYSYRGSAWHGSSLLEALEGITASEAVLKPLASAHSIWEYAVHCTVWIRFPERALVGNFAQPTPQEDWQTPTDTSQQAWLQTLQALENEHKRLCDVLNILSDDVLSQAVPQKNYSVATMLNGVAEHNIYHAGQIMLIRRHAHSARH